MLGVQRSFRGVCLALVFLVGLTSKVSTQSSLPMMSTSTPISAACQDVSPELCAFIATQGLCALSDSHDVQSLCCASCRDNGGSLERSWYVCGFPGDEPDIQCLTRGSEICFAVTTAPSACTKIPDQFGLGERYLRLEFTGISNVRLPSFSWSIHRDPACKASYSLGTSLAGNTQLGSCTAARVSDITLLHFTVLQNCTLEHGNWTCFGTGLPCFHWTRQAEDKCVLSDDSHCVWNSQSCQFKEAGAGCNTLYPPLCSANHCEFDYFAQQCAVSSVCSCSKNGESGPTQVPFEGCSFNHSEPGFQNKPICYMNGGAPAVNMCGCSHASRQFPGAAFRPCLPTNGCNMVLLESDGYAGANGGFVGGNIDANSYGCVPQLGYYTVNYGLSDSRALIALAAQYGVPPENAVWRNLGGMWLLFPFIRAYELVVDIVVTGFVRRNVIPLVKEAPSQSPSSLTGQWSLASDEGLRTQVFVNHTCSSEWPCARPFMLVPLHAVNKSMTVPEKLDAVRDIPPTAAIVLPLEVSVLTHHLVFSVVPVLTLDVPFTYRPALARESGNSFTPSTSHINCYGFSRADPTALVKNASITLEFQSFTTNLKTFRLSLEAYASYHCEVTNFGPNCIGGFYIDKVILTPPALPASSVSALKLVSVTSTCASLTWTKIEERNLNGLFSAYEVNMTQSDKLVQSKTVTSTQALICELMPGTSYSVSIAVVNNVGKGPASTLTFTSRDGVITTSPNLTAVRRSPVTVSLGWDPLPPNEIAGSVDSYHIVQYSSDSTESLQALQPISAGESPDSAVADNTQFDEVTVLGAGTTEFAKTDLDPNLAYAFAIAVSNQDNIGPYGSFQVVGQNPVGTEGPSSSGGSTSSLAVIAFVLIPVIIGIILFIIYRRFPHLRRKPPPALPADIAKGYAIEQDSTVVVHETLDENPVYKFFLGQMPLPNLGATEKAAAAEATMVPVIVKHVQDPHNDDMLTVMVNEIGILHGLRGHPHIVGLLGIFLKKQSAFICLTTRRCTLLHLLRDARPLPARPALIDTDEMLDLSVQVCDGLAFVHSQQIVHRAVCAENIWVTESGEMQLSSFSIAVANNKDLVSEHLLNEMLRTRWMAPESLADSQFTFASDVYSFGILLWEIFSFGARPWAGYSDPEVAQNVTKRGTTLNQPPNCPYHVYKLMLQCWKVSPDERPPITRIRELLQYSVQLSKDSLTEPLMLYAPTHSTSTAGQDVFRRWQEGSDHASNIDTLMQDDSLRMSPSKAASITMFSMAPSEHLSASAQTAHQLPEEIEMQLLNDDDD
eukprot:m.123131 g.123131  ORF g.123131 m.123131 type:complete len:1290 (+) comp15562_c0_seq4:505-4374(+)